MNVSQYSADRGARAAAGTDQDVSPPPVVAEVLHDAVGILGVERGLHRVAESLSGISRAVGVCRNSGTGREDCVLDVRNRLLERVQDPVLGVHIGRGRHRSVAVACLVTGEGWKANTRRSISASRRDASPRKTLTRVGKSAKVGQSARR